MPAASLLTAAASLLMITSIVRNEIGVRISGNQIGAADRARIGGERVRGEICAGVRTRRAACEQSFQRGHPAAPAERLEREQSGFPLPGDEPAASLAPAAGIARASPGGSGGGADRGAGKASPAECETAMAAEAKNSRRKKTEVAAQEAANEGLVKRPEQRGIRQPKV